MTNLGAIVKSIRDVMRQDVGTGSDELRILQLGWMLFFKVFSDKDEELELLDSAYRSPVPAGMHWREWAGDDEGMTGDALLQFVDRRLFPALAGINVSRGGGRALLLRDVFANNFNHMKSGTHLRQVINLLNRVDFNRSKDRQVFGAIYESFLAELQSAGALGEYYTPRAVTRLCAELTAPRHGEKVLDPSCGTGGFLTDAIEHLKQSARTPAQRRAISDNVAGWEYKPLPYLLANTNLILHDIGDPRIRFGDSLAKPLADYRQKDRVDVILANPPFGGVVSDNNDSNFPQNFRTKESADLFLILMINLLKEGGRAAVVLPDGSLTGDGVKERIRRELLEKCSLRAIVRLPNSVFQPYASVATNLLFFEKGGPTRQVWYYEHRLPEGYKAYSKTKPIQFEEFAPLKKWWKNRKAGAQAWRVSMGAIAANGYDLDIKNPRKAKAERQPGSGELIRALHKSLKRSDALLGRLSKGLGRSPMDKQR